MKIVNTLLILENDFLSIKNLNVILKEKHPNYKYYVVYRDFEGPSKKSHLPLFHLWELVNDKEILCPKEVVKYLDLRNN